MHTISQKPFYGCLVLALVAAATLFFRLGSLPLSGADEPRYARIAEEMQRGGLWITPVLEGRPWLEKPPLYYWITIPFFSIFGVSETTARLGPALAGLLSCLAVGWLGARLWTPLAGFLAALILLSSVGIAGFSRAASTDMPMNGCLTVALAILAACTTGTAPVGRVYLAYVFLGFAVLAKGPVALVIAGGICLLFWALDERGGIVRLWRPVVGLVIALAVALPWYWLAFRQNGFAFIAFFFINHNLARYVSDLHHHSQPFYYYLPVLAGLMLPWTGWLPLLVPADLRAQLRRWRDWRPETVFLIAWLIFPLFFFSLSSSKLAGYILPCLPPLALLLGRRLAEHFEQGSPIQRGRTVAWSLLAIVVTAAVATPVIFQRNFGDLEVGLILSLIFSVPGLFAFWALMAGNCRGAVWATSAQGTLLVLALTVFAFPVLGRYLSSRDIASQAVASLEKGESIVTYRFFDHTLFYYSGYRVDGELDDEESLRLYATAHERFLAVAEASRLPELIALRGFTVSTLGQQGKLCLLRIVAH